MKLSEIACRRIETITSSKNSKISKSENGDDDNNDDESMLTIAVMIVMTMMKVATPIIAMMTSMSVLFHASKILETHALFDLRVRQHQEAHYVLLTCTNSCAPWFYLRVSRIRVFLDM